MKPGALQLSEARVAWRRADLSRRTVLSVGSTTIVLPWVGDQALDTARLMLQSHDVVAEMVGPALYVKAISTGDLAAVSSRVLAGEHPDAFALAALMGRYKLDKWDWVLDDDLLTRANAARCIDMDGALTVFRRIAEASMLG